MGREASYDGDDDPLAQVIYEMLLEKGIKGVRYNEAKTAKLVASQIRVNKAFVVALRLLWPALSYKKVQLQRCFELAAEKIADEDKFLVKEGFRKTWKTAQAKRTQCLNRDVAQAGRRKPPPRS